MVDVFLSVFVVCKHIDHTLLDHDQLGEVISISQDIILWKVQPGVYVAEKIILKFTPSLKRRVFKHIIKIANEWSEQRLDQPMLNSGFELTKEVFFLNLVEIKVICLFCINFNGIKQLLREVFVPSFLQVS